MKDTESFGSYACFEFHHLLDLCSIGPRWISDNDARRRYESQLVCEAAEASGLFVCCFFALRKEKKKVSYELQLGLLKSSLNI